MPAIRLFSGSAPRTEESNTSSLSAAEQELDLILAKEGHKKLYYASQANTIRAMLAVAGVNFMVSLFSVYLIMFYDSCHSTGAHKPLNTLFMRES